MGGEPQTPTADQLAAEGTVFERTISSSPWAVPSIASMMTGIYAHKLGLAKWEQPWPKEHLSLFSIASRGGLRVGSFVFDTAHLFRSVPDACVAGSSQDTNSVIKWLERTRGTSFLLFIHYWWTHLPYIDKPMNMSAWKITSDRVLGALRSGNAACKGVKSLYYKAVERFSEVWLPQILNAVDMDNTWVALTSNHGESWGERKETSKLENVFDLHGNTLYNEVIRVPQIIRPPGGDNPRRTTQIVRTVDFTPTMSDLLNLDVRRKTGEIDGISHAQYIREGTPISNLDAVSAMNLDFVDSPASPDTPGEFWNGFALTTEHRKHIWYPENDTHQLFDLKNDPCETCNIYKDSNPDCEAGRRRLMKEFAGAKVYSDPLLKKL